MLRRGGGQRCGKHRRGVEIDNPSSIDRVIGRRVLPELRCESRVSVATAYMSDLESVDVETAPTVERESRRKNP